MSVKSDVTRMAIDEELTGLALKAIRQLNQFMSLSDDAETTAIQLQMVKSAQVSLGVWSRWEQTNTNRAVLEEAIRRRDGRIPAFDAPLSQQDPLRKGEVKPSRPTSPRRRAR